jgi:hypothetical protein
MKDWVENTFTETSQSEKDFKIFLERLLEMLSALVMASFLTATAIFILLGSAEPAGKWLWVCLQVAILVVGATVLMLGARGLLGWVVSLYEED